LVFGISTFLWTRLFQSKKQMLKILKLFSSFLQIQRVFVRTTRQLKRIESVSKSPIYNHFGESIHGASTIRAYRYKARFQSINFELIDQNNQGRNFFLPG